MRFEEVVRKAVLLDPGEHKEFTVDTPISEEQLRFLKQGLRVLDGRYEVKKTGQQSITVRRQ